MLFLQIKVQILRYVLINKVKIIYYNFIIIIIISIILKTTLAQ